jgi:hypothetical protein
MCEVIYILSILSAGNQSYQSYHDNQGRDCSKFGWEVKDPLTIFGCLVLAHSTSLRSWLVYRYIGNTASHRKLIQLFSDCQTAFKIAFVSCGGVEQIVNITKLVTEVTTKVGYWSIGD